MYKFRDRLFFEPSAFSSNRADTTHSAAYVYVHAATEQAALSLSETLARPRRALVTSDFSISPHARVRHIGAHAAACTRICGERNWLRASERRVTPHC